MGIFSRGRAGTDAQKALNTVPARGGWRNVLESYAGAWQQNVEVSVDTAAHNPTIYTCVSAISGDIAKLRFRACADQGGIWTETELPAVSEILRRPNAYQTPLDFYKSWIAGKLFHGNAYILIERDSAGTVAALHPLDPSAVRAMVSDSGAVFYELSADRLAGVAENSVAIPASEIIHDRINAFFHPLVGLSPVMAAGVMATGANTMISGSAKFAANGNRPSGILTTPSAIPDETAAELKETWTSKFTGEGAGNVAILSDDMKYTPLQMAAADAQMVEQLGWTAATIAACFHVPAYMAHAGPLPLNNNVNALLQLYLSQCLQVHLAAITAHLGQAFGLAADVQIRPDLDGLLLMDQANRADVLATYTGAGIMAPNEARARLDLGPVAGGKSPLAQQQYYSLEALSARDAAPAPPDDTTETAIAAFNRGILKRIAAHG